MIEILGANMQSAFDAIGIADGYRKTFSRSIGWEGDVTEVWEVDDSVFQRICGIADEEWESLCPDSWWRSATGSNLGKVNAVYKICGKEINAWDGSWRDDLKDEYLEDSEDCELAEVDQIPFETWEAIWYPRENDNLLDYFCAELGASQPRNVCALAVDLATQNGMTLAELFDRCTVAVEAKD